MNNLSDGVQVGLMMGFLAVIILAGHFVLNKFSSLVSFDGIDGFKPSLGEWHFRYLLLFVLIHHPLKYFKIKRVLADTRDLLALLDELSWLDLSAEQAEIKSVNRDLFTKNTSTQKQYIKLLSNSTSQFLLSEAKNVRDETLTLYQGIDLRELGDNFIRQGSDMCKIARKMNGHNEGIILKGRRWMKYGYLILELSGNSFEERTLDEL